MRGAVQQLEQQKRAKSNNPDDKLGMFRQQANLVAKKKEQVQQRLCRARPLARDPDPKTRTLRPEP